MVLIIFNKYKVVDTIGVKWKGAEVGLGFGPESPLFFIRGGW